MISEITDRQDELLTKVFGDDWKKCVSPHGRKELVERVESGKVSIETTEK